MPRLPHPIPYQGSKRRLASQILALIGPRKVDTFYEPFAGSAAMTIAASHQGRADRFLISDSLDPLVGIWRAILDHPEPLFVEYEQLWLEQRQVEGHFNEVRAEYNRVGGAGRLLYLLARCVKNAPRWNKSGGFSQSADHRRLGMRPVKMREQIYGCHALLSGRAIAEAGDAVEILTRAQPSDLVYLDPPWQGTTEGPNSRYHQGFPRDRLEELLNSLNERNVPWALSYDGRHGTRIYGDPLPEELIGAQVELETGRSSQSTLNGNSALTVESLYLSPNVVSEAPEEVRQLIVV